MSLYIDRFIKIFVAAVRYSLLQGNASDRPKVFAVSPADLVPKDPIPPAFYDDWLNAAGEGNEEAVAQIAILDDVISASDLDLE
jgi:hypothetical protein